MWCLASLAFLGAVVADDGLDKDARLSKAVTVEVQLVALPDALKQLSKESGIPLESSLRLKDLKVTLLAEKDTTLRVMKALASTLDLAWVKSDQGYRLQETEQVSDELRLFRLAEDRAAKAYIQEILTQWQSDDAGALDAKDWGRLLKSLNATQWNAFWNGQPLYLPAPERAKDAPQVPMPPRPGLRLDALRYQLIVNTRAANPPAFPELPTGALAGTPYGKRILSWAERHDSDDLKASVKLKLDDTSWFGRGVAASDLLGALHRATHLTVVADAFRLPVAGALTASSVSDWLTQFSASSHGFVRTDEDVIMFRHPAFWRRRQTEISERALAALESTRVPTPDGYIGFVGGLSERQLLNFTEPNAFLLRVDPGPLLTAMPALRFLTLLSPSERQGAAANGLDARALSGPAQAMFLDILNSSPDANRDMSQKPAFFTWSLRGGTARAKFTGNGRVVEFRISAQEPDLSVLRGF